MITSRPSCRNVRRKNRCACARSMISMDCDMDANEQTSTTRPAGRHDCKPRRIPGSLRAWLGGQTPPIPIVLRVRVKHQASGVVGHQYKPAPRNFCTINIAQFEEFASRTGRIQFVPDELWWFCFLCRVRALLHVRYPFASFGYKFGANRL